MTATANAGPGALWIIESVAVGIRAPVLELTRIIDLPKLAQTGGRLVMGTGAAVLRSAEGRTC